MHCVCIQRVVSFMIMALTEAEDLYGPDSTPKLSLSKFPCKPREPIHMLTPPLHPSVSVPFLWEEAPGKPREAAAPPSAAQRCLELPPGFMFHDDDAKITILPSSTVVLDGPYVGRSLSLACTFSFRKATATAAEEGLVWSEPAKKRLSGGSFGSGRWGSFKEEERWGRGRSVFSHMSGVEDVKVKRRKSCFNLSAINSNLLDIYASFKQAVSWRRGRRRNIEN